MTNSLLETKRSAIPILYVRTATHSSDIHRIFKWARIMSPCLLVLEKLERVLTPGTLDPFLRETDGLEINDGIFMLASADHMDHLGPSLSNRSGRFDRASHFPRPDEEERWLYAEHWRQKLKPKAIVEFPGNLSSDFVNITADFDFAHLKEAFVAAVIAFSADRVDEKSNDEGNRREPEEFWNELKRQVELLRININSSGESRLQHISGVDSRLSRVNCQCSPQRYITSNREQQDLPGASSTDSHFCLTRHEDHLDRDFRHAPLVTDDGWFLSCPDNRL